MNRNRLRWSVGVCLVAVACSPSVAQERGVPFDALTDLGRRHPELRADDSFRSFDDGKIARWVERRDVTTREWVLHVYRADGAQFAAQLTAVVRGAQEVVDKHVFTAQDVQTSRARVTNNLREKLGLPVIEPRSAVAYGTKANGAWDLEWEVVVPGTPDKRVRIDIKGNVIDLPDGGRGAALGEARGAATAAAAKAAKAAAVDDDAADNDLHHPLIYKSRPSTVASQQEPEFFEKVQLTLDAISNDVGAGNTDLNSHVFTLADLVTEQRQVAECDELAVLFVTYMRALGFKAHLRYITYTNNGIPGAHAFAEVKAPPPLNRWVHVDPMYKVVDVPSTYACSEKKQLWEVGLPDDSKSSADVFADSDTAQANPVHDVNNDGMFSPWNDFYLLNKIALGKYNVKCLTTAPHQ